MDLSSKFIDISRYQKVKKIGEGNFAEVFLVKMKNNNEKFAAKLFSKPPVDSSQSLAIHESTIYHILNHPSIAKFYGISFSSFDDNDKLVPTILLEYFYNTNLKNVLDSEQKTLTPPGWSSTKKCICIIGTANAMKYIHKKGIIHNNLNPYSIFLDDDFYPQIGSFLKSEFIQSFKNTEELKMPNKNSDVRFIAPEVFDENKHTTAVDVYSFGMILYQVATEKEPFFNDGTIYDYSKIMSIVKNGNRPKLTNYVTDQMKELITKCWDQDPEKRPSFDEIYQKLSSDYKSYFIQDFDSDEIDNYILDIEELVALNNQDEEKIINIPKETISSDKIPAERKIKEEENFFIDADEEKNYEVIHKIGEGSTSIAYKIIDKRTLKPLCKKVLKANEIQFEDIKNGMKEFQILHTLDHPCISKAIGIDISEQIKDDKGEDITTIALFLEFNDFLLKDCLSKEIINNTLKTRIVVEISHGLRYIHSKHMIYRDLKIDNIMLNSIFEVKLIDFGLIKVNEILFGEETMSNITMTKCVGLDVFMSPEMINEDDYDSKTDVYSFGIVLYFIFFGHLPTQSLKDRSLLKPIELPNETNTITKCCIELMRKCLSIDSKERPSFDEILEFIRVNNFMLATDVDPSIVSQRDNELENLKKHDYNKINIDEESKKFNWKLMN